MENSTKSKVVVIGGTSGLGLATAGLFFNKDYEVVVGSHTTERLESSSLKFPNIQAYEIDVRNDASVEDFFKKVGEVDYLITSFSIKFPDQPLTESNIDNFKSFADVKLWGTVRCIKSGQKYIREGGSVIIISGAVSKKGRKGAHVKTLVNSALEGLTKSLASELGPSIRVNCISPGRFDSKGEMTKEVKEEFGNLNPLNYVGNSNDISELIFTVATNKFMTGSITYIDAGWTAV